MERSARELYGLAAGLSAVGLAWALRAFHGAETMTPLCPTQRFFGFACPGCGGTRAVTHLLHGHWAEAVVANPLALLVALAGLWVMVLLLNDWITGQRRLLRQYQWLEATLRQPAVWPLAALLVLANWIWNLFKY